MVNGSLVPSVDQTVPFTKDCQTDTLDRCESCPNGRASAEPDLENGGAFEVDFGDVLINEITHVLNGIITDPNLNGFYDAGRPRGAGQVPGGRPARAGRRPRPRGSSPRLRPHARSRCPTTWARTPTLLNTYDITFSDAHQYYTAQQSSTPRRGMPPDYYGQCVPYAQLTPRFPIPAQVDPNQLVGFDPSTTIATHGGPGVRAGTSATAAHTAVVTCPTEKPGDLQPEHLPRLHHPRHVHRDADRHRQRRQRASASRRTFKVLGAAPAGGGSGRLRRRRLRLRRRRHRFRHRRRLGRRHDGARDHHGDQHDHDGHDSHHRRGPGRSCRRRSPSRSS